MTEITLEYLTQLHKDLEKRFPKPELGFPNPADVGPITYERIRRQCVPAEAKMIPDRFSALHLHVRTDVPEGFVHPCTCQQRIEFIHKDLL